MQCEESLGLQSVGDPLTRPVARCSSASDSVNLFSTNQGWHITIRTGVKHAVSQSPSKMEAPGGTRQQGFQARANPRTAMNNLAQAIQHLVVASEQPEESASKQELGQAGFMLQGAG